MKIRIALLAAAVAQLAYASSAAHADTPDWSQQLSLAAQEQPRAVPLVARSMVDLTNVVTGLEGAFAAPMAIYADAMARGPMQVRMLAAYELGMAHINIMVRARAAIPAGADPDLTLHHELEGMLAPCAQAAASAFAEADRLAAADPQRASANAVMRDTMIAAHDAHRKLAGEQLAARR